MNKSYRMKKSHRPIKPSDLTVGQKFTLIGDDGLFTGKIAIVLNDYKSFVASNGCTYGLEGTYVKVKEEIQMRE